MNQQTCGVQILCGQTHREAQILEDSTKAINLLLHRLATPVPKPIPFRLLQSHCRSDLGGPGGRVAEYDVRILDVADEILFADRVADAPSCGVECLSYGADADGLAGDVVVDGRYSGHGWGVAEVLVDFVG